MAAQYRDENDRGRAIDENLDNFLTSCVEGA